MTTITELLIKTAAKKKTKEERQKEQDARYAKRGAEIGAGIGIGAQALGELAVRSVTPRSRRVRRHGWGQRAANLGINSAIGAGLGYGYSKIKGV